MTSIDPQIITIIVIAVTAIISFMGFQNYNNNPVFNGLCFHIGSILGPKKEWYRMLSSALIHGDMMHLLFNMLTLWFFAPFVISRFGFGGFFILYIGSILGGSLVSLWLHRDEYYYRAIGASGGVIGVVFAMIAIYPKMSLFLFFIPIPIPAWIFGVIYLTISIYGMQKSLGNIGHDAHIGGALAGIIISFIYFPQMILNNWYYLVINLLPIIYFVYLMMQKRDD